MFHQKEFKLKIKRTVQFQPYQWCMALEIAIRFLLIHIILTFLGMHICEKIIIEYQNYKLGRNLSQFIVFIIIELCYLKIQQKIDWCLNVFLKYLKKPNISNGAPSVIHELKLVLFYVLVLLSSCSCLAACTYQVHLHTEGPRLMRLLGLGKSRISQNSH